MNRIVFLQHRQKDFYFRILVYHQSEKYFYAKEYEFKYGNSYHLKLFLLELAEKVINSCNSKVEHLELRMFTCQISIKGKYIKSYKTIEDLEKYLNGKNLENPRKGTRYYIERDIIA